MVVQSKSPFASGIVLVSTRDGTYRICIVHRKLNAMTKKDAYPIPRIYDSIEELGAGNHFASLNLTSGFWQIPLSENAT